MNAEPKGKLKAYYEQAASWSADRQDELRRSRRTAWFVAGVAGGIALLEALALVFLTPLKTEVPYVLTVDRQTGFVQALDPLDQSRITADSALTRSFVAQYVVARESFSLASLKSDYRKVALWSAGDARSRYLAEMQSSNPASPLSALPRGAQQEVQIHSVSSLGPNTALVRFATMRTDPAASGQLPQRWAAVMTYRFTTQGMSAADRIDNPLGFQVLRYRRDPELVPAGIPAAVEAAPPALAAPARQHQIGPNGMVTP